MGYRRFEVRSEQLDFEIRGIIDFNKSTKLLGVEKIEALASVIGSEKVHSF